MPHTVEEAVFATQASRSGKDPALVGQLTVVEANQHWAEQQRDKRLALAASLLVGGVQLPAEEGRYEDHMKAALSWDNRAKRLRSEAVSKRAALVKVVSEELVYRPDGEHSYFRDLVAMQTRMIAVPGADERLRRNDEQVEHAIREKRAAGQRLLSRLGGSMVDRRVVGATESRSLSMGGAGGSFSPPLWLVQHWADAPRPTRVLAAQIPSFLLGRGSSVSIPRISGDGVIVGPTAENTNSSEPGNEEDLAVTSSVAWLTGAVSGSLQLFELSANPAFDSVIYTQLGRAFDAQLEQQVVNGSGTGGNLVGLLNLAGIDEVTYTSATPTGAAFLGAVASAVANVGQTRFLPAEIVVMTPARWAWLASSLDSSGRPFVPPTDRPAGPGPAVGNWAGKPIFEAPALPSNLGTGANQDVVIVTRPSDHLLFESVPVLATNVDAAGLAGQLTVIVTLGGSAAFLGGLQPTATSLVSGTGLSTPAFA